MPRSPVSYFGGKQLLAERIASSFPDHRHYIEVFAGSLAVLLAKPRSRQETINDLDNHLMNFWAVLRDRPQDLERVCALTPHSRAEREAAYAIPYEADDLERARLVFVALTQGRTGSLTRTGWRHNSAPTSTSMPVVLQRYAGRIAPAARRLMGVSLECRPAMEIVESYGGERNSLLYLDPPYLTDPGTRRGGEYRVEMRSAAEHRKLLEVAVEVDAAVVISGYGNAIYDEVLSGWYRYEIAAWTTQSGVRADRVEVLWSNRPLAGFGDTALSLQEPLPVTETPARCDGCSAVLRHPKTGRRRRWCSEACRIAAWRARRDVDDS